MYPEDISIGRRTLITSGTKILAHFLDVTGDELRMLRGKVAIGDDVFIGLNVLIVQPVRIGNGAIIAAGSVVTSDIEDGAIVAGNPARLVRRRALPFPVKG